MKVVVEHVAASFCKLTRFTREKCSVVQLRFLLVDELVHTIELLCRHVINALLVLKTFPFLTYKWRLRVREKKSEID